MGTVRAKFSEVRNSKSRLAPARSQLAGMARASKRSYLAILWEIARLHLGAGRLSLDEYRELSLFDAGVYRGTNKKTFVGERAAHQIWLQVNYNIELFALATNKVASAMWLAAHGLPILPILCVFHESVGRANSHFFQNEDELLTFLRRKESYPLFGKPVDGCQSIGSASFDGYSQTNDSLISATGQLISLDNFVAQVRAHSSSGYQFQSRVSPHTKVRDICGDRLATVRVLTIVKDGKPEILRACWKIPAGGNVADNFWRPGNLLAQLDTNGYVLRVLRRSGPGIDEITHHPDTGARIVGTKIPNWDKVVQLALEGAKVIRALPLVGWDIAPVDSGAVIVEANVTPDFRLHQIADRSGILDQTFERFIQMRKRSAATAQSENKRILDNARRKSHSDLITDAALAGYCVARHKLSLGHRLRLNHNGDTAL